MIRNAVVTLGRICAQKDPLYFAEAAEHYRYRGIRTWVWIGGPSEDDKKATEYVERLNEAGVTITGWLPRDEALTWLSLAHVYVHTAAWEGNPMTIYEAAVRGLPVIARNIPAVKAEGLLYLTTSPEHMAGWVRALDDEHQWRRAAWWSMGWVRDHMEKDQRLALQQTYGLLDMTTMPPR